MPINDSHRPVLAQFFQANIGGREQAAQQQQQPAGAGVAWLVEFWMLSAGAQEKILAEWVEAQRGAVQAAADQQLAALDDLGQQVNGNRAERRRSTRTKKAAT